MIKEMCNKCRNEVIEDRKLDNTVWNCPNCGLEEYQSVNILTEETNKKSLKDCLQKGENCTILIGPEGDFSSKEIQLALENQYIPISLGNTRLRTETAAVVACHSVVFENE